MSLRIQFLPRLLLLLVVVFCPVIMAQRPGYTDTPFLPGGKWRVHDSARPYPRIVQGTPLFTAPPKDATVLFDGKNLDSFASGNGKAKWVVRNGYVEVNGTGDIGTRQSFGSCQLHLEWATPAKVKGKSQGRGNSGVFLMGRYELQVLDSYKNPAYSDGQAASLYGQQPPLVNASMPPGEWQSYDIFFTAPKFSLGKLQAPARITVLHNGILVQNNVAFIGATKHRAVATYAEHGAAPFRLQDHGNPVRYRNIWIRPTDTKKTR